ncbi:hypothetical protein M9458_030607, partial [Cirrhinus mrigala]
MDHPAILILLLEQGDRSLKDHTKDFVFLSKYMYYPDSCLSSFYRTGLNTATRAQLASPQIIVRTVDIMDNDTSPTQDPEPSPPPPRLAEHEPEPTTDGEPNATERSLKEATARRIATEPEPIPSNQVREPVTLNATE